MIYWIHGTLEHIFTLEISLHPMPQKFPMQITSNVNFRWITLKLYDSHQTVLKFAFLMVQEVRIVWTFTTMRNLWTPININIKLNPQGTTIRHLSHLGCVTNYVSLNWFNLKRRVYTSYTNTFKPKQDTFQDNYYYYYVNTKKT